MSLRTFDMRHAALALAVSAVVFSAPSSAAGRVNLSGLGNNDPVDGFIVTYRAGSPVKANALSLQRSLDRAASAAFGSARSLKLRRERTLGVGADLIVADRALDRVDAETLMLQIATDPDVVAIEPNIRLYPTLTPNDTHYNLQYGFKSGVGGTNADQAWNLGFLGAGQIVAVIDTGYRPHVDLGANIINGYDFISNTFVANDGNGRDSSALDPGDWVTASQCFSGSQARNSSWHGTHVAGTVAALTNNGLGVAGMAFNAKVLAVRVLGRCGGSLADIADAVVWASGGTVAGVADVGANKAGVINMSLGGSGSCAGSVMQTAISQALLNGTTVVVAAGNNNADASAFTPASCTGTGLIVVGATDSTATRAGFSNFGARLNISAPGVGITSTLNAGTTSPAADNYVPYDGTSMASPHVAGAVALMQSAYPRSPKNVADIIQSTVKPFSVACPQGCGAGILNADAAVRAAAAWPLATFNPVASTTCASSTMIYTLNNTSVDPNNDIVGYLWNLGDGRTSTASSPTVKYPRATTWTVTLTVTDAAGNTSSGSMLIGYRCQNPPGNPPTT